MKSKKYLIREFSEFNLQRMNPDSAQISTHVDNPQLSINAFDKHQDKIRQALSRIGDISKSVYNASSLGKLKGMMNLSDQDIKSLKIKKVLKSEGLNYNVYITFQIGENEYWGVIKNFFTNPDFKSEVFSDQNLVQTKEWEIKTKGLILKLLRKWFNPQFGKFKLVGDEIKCYSTETGKMLTMEGGSEIEILKSYEDQIIFSKDGENYSLKGDDFVYFNWRFEQIV